VCIYVVQTKLRQCNRFENRHGCSVVGLRQFDLVPKSYLADVNTSAQGMQGALGQSVHSSHCSVQTPDAAANSRLFRGSRAWKQVNTCSSLLAEACNRSPAAHSQLNICLRTGSKTESKSIFRFFNKSSETHFTATKVSGNFAA